MDGDTSPVILPVIALDLTNPIAYQMLTECLELYFFCAPRSISSFPRGRKEG